MKVFLIMESSQKYHLIHVTIEQFFTKSPTVDRVQRSMFISVTVALKQPTVRHRSQLTVIICDQHLQPSVSIQTVPGVTSQSRCTITIHHLVICYLLVPLAVTVVYSPAPLHSSHPPHFPTNHPFRRHRVSPFLPYLLLFPLSL